MSRYRCYPTPEQEENLLEHCGHARYIWNLALEQWSFRVRGRRVPNYSQQDRQLTEARAEFPWLAAGSSIVQQQSLRDFVQAVARFWRGSSKRPTWRKRGEHEGFGIVGPAARRIRKLNRKWSAVLVPKVGWVKFRRTRDLPDAKSYRIKRDSSGRWHIMFAHIPAPIENPGTYEVVGVDRGVTVSAMLSTGEALKVPGLTHKQQERLTRLHRKASRKKVRGRATSKRLKITRHSVNRLRAREVDRRKNWVEHVSTNLARRFDLIRVENLRVSDMTRSPRGTSAEPGVNVRQRAAVNKSIRAAGWGALVRRLEDKAHYRVERINPAFTSVTCSVCRHVDRESRESQAVFRCTACGHTENADVNAAKNIAAGRAVTARGAVAIGQATNREPWLAPASAGEARISTLKARGEGVNAASPGSGRARSAPRTGQ